MRFIKKSFFQQSREESNPIPTTTENPTTRSTSTENIDAITPTELSTVKPKVHYNASSFNFLAELLTKAETREKPIEAADKEFKEETVKPVVQQQERTQGKMSNSVDCGDETCTLHVQCKENCIVYLDTNRTHCNIPCELSGCDYKFSGGGGYCRFWKCSPSPTTTTTTTTTVTTTLIPNSTTTSVPFVTIGPAVEKSINWVSIVSYLVIAILLLVVLVLIIMYCRSCLRLRQFENRQWSYEFGMIKTRNERERDRQAELEKKNQKKAKNRRDIFERSFCNPLCNSNRSSEGQPSGSESTSNSPPPQSTPSSSNQPNPKTVQQASKVVEVTADVHPIPQPIPQPPPFEVPKPPPIQSTENVRTLERNSTATLPYAGHVSQPIAIEQPQVLFSLCNSSSASALENSPLLMRNEMPGGSFDSASSLYSTFGYKTFEQHRRDRELELQKFASTQFFMMKQLEDKARIPEQQLQQALQLKSQLEQQRTQLQLQNEITELQQQLRDLESRNALLQERHVVKTNPLYANIAKLQSQALCLTNEIQRQNDTLRRLQFQ